MLRVDLIHDVHGDPAGEVGVDEDHVPEVEPGRFQNSAHAVQGELYLGGGRIGDLAGGPVPSQHAGHVEAIARDHPSRVNAPGRHYRRRDDLLHTQFAHGHCVDLDRRLGGHPVDAQDGPGRRVPGKVAGPHLIQIVVAHRLVQVYLGVDDVLHGQSGGVDDRLDVLQTLPHLLLGRGRKLAVREPRSLPRHVEKVPGKDARTVRSHGLGTGRENHAAVGRRQDQRDNHKQPNSSSHTAYSTVERL